MYLRKCIRMQYESHVAIAQFHTQEKDEKAKLLPYMAELKQHLQQLQLIHDHICKKADEALGHASPLK